MCSNKCAFVSPKLGRMIWSSSQEIVADRILSYRPPSNSIMSKVNPSYENAFTASICLLHLYPLQSIALWLWLWCLNTCEFLCVRTPPLPLLTCSFDRTITAAITQCRVPLVSHLLFEQVLLQSPCCGMRIRDRWGACPRVQTHGQIHRPSPRSCKWTNDV